MRAFILTILSLATLLALPNNAANADEYAWMATGSAGFGILDVTSGEFAPCPINTQRRTLAGLAIGANHRLYAQIAYSDEFGRVVPAAGKFRVIARNHVRAVSMGSVDGTIYLIDPHMNFYSINATTGAATLIGNTGLKFAFQDWFGLSVGARHLYFYFNNELYRINLLTGKARKVAAETTNIGPMAKIAGVLYTGVQSKPPAVDSVDPKTGALTPVSTVKPEINAFWGLAPARHSGCS